MEKANKTVQITVLGSRDRVSKQIKQLSGWQFNHSKWQQGRFRKVKIHSEDEQQTLLSITTSFLGLVALAQIDVQLKDELSLDVCLMQTKAFFSKSVLLIAAFYAIFLSAIMISSYNILLKLPYLGLICLIAYWTFRGIYHDRDKLVEDLMRIQNTQ